MYQLMQHFGLLLSLQSCLYELCLLFDLIPCNCSAEAVKVDDSTKTEIPLQSTGSNPILDFRASWAKRNNMASSHVSYADRHRRGGDLIHRHVLLIFS